MPRDIPERDWKVFRELRALALERFCERVLKEVGQRLAVPGKSSHDRYLDVYRLIEERDRELARAFDAPLRSQAILQITLLVKLDLLTQEELTRFTPVTQEIVTELTALRRR